MIVIVRISRDHALVVHFHC